MLLHIHLQIPQTVQLRKRLSVVEAQVIVAHVQPDQCGTAVGQVLERERGQAVILEEQPFEPRQTGKRS